MFLLSPMAVSVTDEIRLTQTGEMQYSALDWQRALVVNKRLRIEMQLWWFKHQDVRWVSSRWGVSGISNWEKASRLLQDGV